MSSPEIEFAEWPTIIENDALHLLDVIYKNGSETFTFTDPAADIVIPPERQMEDTLVARFFSFEQNAIFRISCSPGAYRVLDEHGLVQLWEASARQGGRPASTTFKVRNHGWSRESHLSFAMGATDGYSYLVLTAWDCLELICGAPPTVTKERDVLAQSWIARR